MEVCSPGGLVEQDSLGCRLKNSFESNVPEQMNHQMSTSESVIKKARALVSTESTEVKMSGPLSSFTGWE